MTTIDLNRMFKDSFAVTNLPEAKLEFNPELTIVIDAHLLSTWHTCEKKYEYFNVQHLVPKKKKAAPAFGIVMHEAIAAYRIARKNGLPFDKALTTGAEVLGNSYRKFMPPESLSEVAQDDRRSLRNALRIYGGYCYHYEPMLLKFHYVETPFAMYLGQAKCPSPQGFILKDVIYVGIIDAIFEQQATIYVNDLKSSAWAISQNYLDQFHMNQGLIGYCVAARELLGIDTHDAIVHAFWVANEAKSGKGKPLDEYFYTQPLHWSDDQLDEWRFNTLKSIERIEAAKAENFYEMAYSYDCGLFGGCDYFGLCKSHPKIRPTLINLDYDRALWSPLEDERLIKMEDMG